MEREVVDRKALHDDLVNAFMEYQYRLDLPFPSPTETKAVIILRYRSDPLFHNKVNNLVTGVMGIVNKHVEFMQS